MEQVYEGFLEDGKFMPFDNEAKMMGRKRVRVTVLDEKENLPQNISALLKFLDALDGIKDEDEPINFERLDFKERAKI